MATIVVSIDGTKLAAVCCDEYDVVSVGVHGTRVEPELATADMTASRYPEGGESTYLIWISDLALSPGQTVTVSFCEEGSSSGPGKTIEELYPDERPSDETDFTLTAQMVQELRARPRYRSSWAFELRASNGVSYTGRTGEGEHGFGFSVLWNHHRPERASVSLHSYTLESVEKRTPMHYYVRTHLEMGSSVDLVVAA